MKKRVAIINRKTTETTIIGKLNIDGTGKSKIDTGIGLLDHMLQLVAFWGCFDLEIKAKGDLNIDMHHTNEDVGIALGKAFKEALGDMKGIKRFGCFSVPMEDVIATVTLDISGRGLFKRRISSIASEAPQAEKGYAFKDVEHFFEAFSKNMGINLIVFVEPTVIDLHTTLEPIFKALGIALDMAMQIDLRRKGIPSTKGIID